MGAGQDGHGPLNFTQMASLFITETSLFLHTENVTGPATIKAALSGQTNHNIMQGGFKRTFHLS